MANGWDTRMAVMTSGTYGWPIIIFKFGKSVRINGRKFVTEDLVGARSSALVTQVFDDSKASMQLRLARRADARSINEGGDLLLQLMLRA